MKKKMKNGSEEASEFHFLAQNSVLFTEYRECEWKIAQEEENVERDIFRYLSFEWGFCSTAHVY